MSDICVLTTVYNGEKYICSSVESILSQSLCDFEYIIVDDGSTDGTFDYLSSIADPRLKVISIPKSGRGIALNRGVEECRSKYVVILDADDISSEFRLEIQYQYMQEHQEIAVLATKCTVNEAHIIKTVTKKIEASCIDNKSFIKRNPICHSSVMMRYSTLKEVGGYDEARDVLFDYDLWIRIASRGYVFSVIYLPLVFKRIHKEQSFERKRRYYYLLEATKLKLRAKRYFSESITDYSYIFLSFLYGFIPVFIRKKLMGKL